MTRATVRSTTTTVIIIMTMTATITTTVITTTISSFHGGARPRVLSCSQWTLRG
jgi:hypothetical protein